MSHDQPSRLACRAPATLRLPCLHHPITATGDPMTRRPAIPSATYTTGDLTAMSDLDTFTARTTRIDGEAYVAVTDVVGYLDAHAQRWDHYAADLKDAGEPDPYDLEQAEQRHDDQVGAERIAQELTRRAGDLVGLVAYAMAHADHTTARPVDEGVLAMRGLLHGLALSAPVYALGALTAWALTR